MNRYLLASSSVFSLGVFWAFTAMAQDNSTTSPSNATQVETVVVTGSRIQRPGYEAPTPLTALPAEELLATNPSDVGDALRQLPILSATTGARGSTGSGGAGGTFLNLRNLGAGNTLVLLDGSRFVPTSETATIDINMLPQQLVQRVDIVTGGASAVYGSDAVAGVVNFILDKEYEGIKGEVEAGIDNAGDDQEAGFKIAAGTSFGGGRGHIIASAEFYQSAGVYSLIDTPLGKKSCQIITNTAGSPTTESFQCGVTSSQANFTGIISSPSKLKGTTFDNNGNAIPFVYGTDVTSTTQVGGSGIPLSFLPGAEPVKRGVFYERTGWDVNDDLNVYLEASYGIADYDYQIGSYDQNLGATALTINANNAYLPASLASTMAANGIQSFTLNKYFADLPRTWIENNNATMRVVAGAQGKVFSDWTWDVHFEAGQTDESVTALNDEDLGHMANAANAVINPANGQIVCASSITNPTNGCVPFNVFGDAGVSAPTNGKGFNSATEGQLGYLTGTDWKKIMVIEDDAAANLSGNPFDDWAGTVSVAIGLEWRHESMAQIADPYGLSISPVTGVPGPFRVGNYAPQSGSYDVIEGYVETVVPLLRDLPFAKSLDFNGAVRETNYSNYGNAFTFKAGLTWDVTDEVRFRSTRSRDVRAPNLTELYAASSAGHASVIDYGTPGNPVNAQAEVYTLGNPNLKPEDSDTTTLGVVYKPAWLAGFEGSVDGYRIQVTNAISAIGAQQIVQECAGGSTAECGFVLRTANGSLFGVNTEPQNVESIETEGVDFEGNYQFSLADWTGLDGNVTLHGVGNYVSKYIQNVAGVPTVNFAGENGVNVVPQWRWTFQTSYTDGPFSIFTQARWSGAGWYDKSLPASVLPQIHVGGQTLVDLDLEYAIPVGHGVVTPYFNVTDIFNDQPPPNPGSASAVYGSNGYDPLGRFFRTGVRFSF